MLSTSNQPIAPSIRLKVVLLATAMFSVMGGPALAPALPSIKAAYPHINNIELWVKILVAISGLFAAIGAPLFGWISDRWGRKPALFIALLTWGVFGSSGMIPQPFWMLVVGRALLGFSLGGLLTANTAMIADSFSQNQRRQMMGLQTTCTSVGIMVALISCGLLTDFHWRSSFVIFLPAFAILPLIYRCPEPQRSQAKTNSKSKLPIGLFWLGLFGLFAMLTFNVIPTQLPFFVTTMNISSAAKVGMLLSLLPISSAIAGRFYARLARRTNPWAFFLMAAMLMLVGFYTISLMQNISGVIFGLILIGAGFGMTIPHINFVIAQVVPAESLGRSMGIVTSCKFLGLFLSPILFQPIIAISSYYTMLQTAGWIIFSIAVLVWLISKTTSQFKFVKEST